MPAYRCAYCKTPLGDRPAARCPACGRVMRPGPGIARRSPEAIRTRRRALERIAREAERERRRIAAHTPPLLGNRPAILLPALLVLIVLGVMLGIRSRKAGTDIEPAWLIAESELQTLSIALGRFRTHVGRYPSEAEGLRALRIEPGLPGWQGPYITHLRNDPWGNPYRYVVDSDGFPALYAAGTDGHPGTESDIAADPRDLDVGTDWTNNWQRLRDRLPGARILNSPP